VYIARLVKQYGRATAPEFNHRPQVFEPRVQSQAGPYGTYGGNVALEQGFLRVLRAPPFNIHARISFIYIRR